MPCPTAPCELANQLRRRRSGACGAPRSRFLCARARLPSRARSVHSERANRVGRGDQGVSMLVSTRYCCVSSGVVVRSRLVVGVRSPGLTLNDPFAARTEKRVEGSTAAMTPFLPLPWPSSRWNARKLERGHGFGTQCRNAHYYCTCVEAVRRTYSGVHESRTTYVGTTSSNFSHTAVKSRNNSSNFSLTHTTARRHPWAGWVVCQNHARQNISASRSLLKTPWLSHNGIGQSLVLHEKKAAQRA